MELISKAGEHPGRFDGWHQPRGGGGGKIRYCILAEDANNSPVRAFRASMAGDGTVTANDPVEIFWLYFHSELLSAPKTARAGYPCIYGIDDEGRDTFLGNPCINSCETSASINPSGLPDGTVGAAYSGTVIFSGLNGSGVSATGLPPGLSINSATGGITGTPTTANTYLVKFEGQDSSGCKLTVMEEIVISPSGGGGGDDENPSPEPGNGPLPP